MPAPENIVGWHAHVYFDAETFDRARDLCERARDAFGVSMGRMHRQPVGPHPMWSCQLAFAPETFGALIPWLGQNRGDLTVFIHTMTGDDLYDHTQGTMWMGSIESLDLSIFDETDQAAPD